MPVRMCRLFLAPYSRRSSTMNFASVDGAETSGAKPICWRKANPLRIARSHARTYHAPA